MTCQRNGLHECRWISMRSVVVAVLLEMGRIEFGVVTLSEGGASSGQWIPRQDECSRGHWFLRRRSVLGNNWVPCYLSSRVSDEVGHMFWSWCGPETNHYRYPLNFLFLQAPRRKSEAYWFGSDLKSWGVVYLKRLIKIPFCILSFPWKLE